MIFLLLTTISNKNVREKCIDVLVENMEAGTSDVCVERTTATLFDPQQVSKPMTATLFIIRRWSLKS